MKKYEIFNYGLLNGKFFIQDYDPTNWNISEKEESILKSGPDHLEYRSTWKNIVNTRTFEYDGKIFSLEEDNRNFILYIIENEK